VSHVVTATATYNSLDTLALAADKLGLELIRDKKNFKWFGRWVNDYHGGNAAYKHGIDPKTYGQCDHVLKRRGVEGAYEIGLVSNDSGAYRIVYDNYASGNILHGIVGASGEHLATAYATAAVESYAHQLGCQPSITKVNDNVIIRLTL